MLGREPQPFDIHWLTWNIIKNEPVGHSSLDATAKFLTENLYGDPEFAQKFAETEKRTEKYAKGVFDVFSVKGQERPQIRQRSGADDGGTGAAGLGPDAGRNPGGPTGPSAAAAGAGEISGQRYMPAGEAVQGAPKRYESVDSFREHWNSLGVRNMTDIRSKGAPDEHIRPSKIEVDKASRNKGLGTAFMQDLTEFADSQGMQIRLNPSDELGATSKGRLEKFYKRFGFVENKPGKNKDYAISERFYRPASQEQRFMPSGIDESTGLPLNNDGTVTVYHHTNKKSAQSIQSTGVLKSAGEPDVYVTTETNPVTGYGSDVVKINVDPSQLQIDDEFPGGRKDFRLSVGKPGGSIRVNVIQDPRFMPSPDSAMPGAYSFPGGYRALPGKAKGSFRIYGPAGSLLGIASSLDEAQRILRRKNK